MIRTELIHPMIVHFPIALLVTAFVFYVLSLVKESDFLKGAFKLLLVLGTIAAGAAVVTGLLAESRAAHSDAAHAVLTGYHKPLGFAVLGFAAVLSFWGVIIEWKLKGVSAYSFLIFFAAAIILLALTGHYGATMVYEHGMGVNPKILMPMEHGHSGDEDHGHSEECDDYEDACDTGIEEEMHEGGHGHSADEAHHSEPGEMDDDEEDMEHNGHEAGSVDQNQDESEQHDHSGHEH